MTEQGFYSRDTQVSWACAALLSGRAIGHKAEIAEARGWRLAAIVWRLMSKYSWPITTEHIGPENHTCYKLVPGTDWAKLTFPPSARSLLKGVTA